MAKLSSRERRALPDRAFAYIDSVGNRRLPIHDEAHVRNALARFDRVRFEDDAARDRARVRLLGAAKRYGIVPVGFITGQLRSERSAHTSDLSMLPTGTVTFLLCDVEGSTTLLQHLGDGYAEVIRDVRSVIGAAVRHEGGHKVDAHGDEYFAVFERTPPAIRAAIEVQRTMAAHQWPDGSRVRVRAGVHAGRPTLTDTGYVGLAVHTVARICSVGHGAQIVTSARAKAAANDMPGVRFKGLGRHHLAGLGTPESLYQVVAKGLPSGFPSLRV